MEQPLAIQTTPSTPKGQISAPVALPSTPTSLATSTLSSSTTTAGQLLSPALLRKRPRSSDNTVAPPSKDNGSRGSPRLLPSKLASQSKYSSRPMTALSAMADEKRQREEREENGYQQSPNPATRVIEVLSSDNGHAMSSLQHAPAAANTMSESTANSVMQPEKVVGNEGSMQISATSKSPSSTLNSPTVATRGGEIARVASPAQLGNLRGDDVDMQRDQDGEGDETEGKDVDGKDGQSNKAFTFPGPLSNTQTGNDIRRGMSLPHSGFGRESPKSTSVKKHKCPYCSTDFTRHHNLKSHLLTHSHEKPYMCQTCDSRFRRLHDLKRHTKLHTGERPHVCPKCNRSFARGDALARHNKGQGGCAGRRSSVGSYGGDGPGGDDSMDGLMYTGEPSHEPEQLEEDLDETDERRKSLPSIRKHDAPPDAHHGKQAENSGTFQTRQPSTYPPVAARQSTGGLYPPGASYGGGASPSASPNSQATQFSGPGSSSSAFQVGGQNIFSQGGMTESPKPLSPAGAASHQLGHNESGIHRNRSPSLTTQFQQDRYGRRTNTRHTPPPPIGLPPIPRVPNSNAPQLPSLPGLTPPDPRFTLHSQTVGASQVLPSGHGSHPGPPLTPGGTPTSYHSHQGNINSNSTSHSSQAHGSGEGINNIYGQSDSRLWEYIQRLEGRVNMLQDEVSSLKSQLSMGARR